MYRCFDELMDTIKENPVKKTIAVAAAHDTEVLECASQARKAGIADFILIGDADKIKQTLMLLEEDISSYQIINTPDDLSAAEKAVSLVGSGKAEVLMKGHLHTSIFLKALFSKDYHLVPMGALVSQITVSEFPAQNRLILLTDCAINVTPSYNEKIKIIENAVLLAHKLGIECPATACLAPVEVVNEKMPETIEAAMLSKACQRGQITGCCIDGPLAMDNAVSPEAAAAKGITGPVAGKADILLMPNLSTGNALDKALRYFAGLKTGSAVIGAGVPIVMTSRSDTSRNKLHAVALSVL